DIFWRNKWLVRIVSRIVKSGNGGYLTSFRDFQHLLKGVEILPSEIPSRNFHKRDGITRRRYGKCNKFATQQVHVRVHREQREIFFHMVSCPESNHRISRNNEFGNNRR